MIRPIFHSKVNKKVLFIYILILSVIIFLFNILLLCIFQRIKTELKSENSKYFSNLDWEGKDINDIPCTRIPAFDRKARGTERIYRVKINSQGFRDYEYKLEKPKNCIRIAAVGDSVTFGEGVNLEDTYVKQLEKDLNNYCNRKVEVLNFGASGSGTVNELELIQKKVLLYNPDFIMLQIDPNDSNVIKQIKKVDPFLNTIILKLKESKFKLSQWLKCKLEFYKYYKYRKNMTIEDEYNNVVIPLRMIMDICKEKGTKLIILSYDPSYRGPFYQKVLEFIVGQNLPLLDLKTTKFGRLSYKERYVDGRLDRNGYALDAHPNKYGGKIIAEDIVEFLRNIPEFRNNFISGKVK